MNAIFYKYVTGSFFAGLHDVHQLSMLPPLASCFPVRTVDLVVWTCYVQPMGADGTARRTKPIEEPISKLTLYCPARLNTNPRVHETHPIQTHPLSAHRSPSSHNHIISSHHSFITSQTPPPNPPHPPYNPLVLSSLPSIHPSNVRASLTLTPILNPFGSSVKLVFDALHSSASRIGASFLSWGGRISNAEISRINAVYSSRFARCEPAHMRDPAP